MKKFFYLSSLLFAFLACPLLTSCGDDDDDNGGNNGTENGGVVNPRNVFTAGLPKQVNGFDIHTNSQGLVTSIEGTDPEEGRYITITFEYLQQTKGDSDTDVIMTINEGDDYTTICSMELNEQGFVSYCYEEEFSPYDEPSYQSWKFEYTKDGHLNKMTRSEGNNEVTAITYENGDITKVRTASDDDNEESVTKVFYTNSKIDEMIPNKGCIMLFDETFDIDMDEMKWAYYAGLLGKATKHLPLLIIDDEGDEVEYRWKFNKNNMPLSFGSSYTFTW